MAGRGGAKGGARRGGGRGGREWSWCVGGTLSEWEERRTDGKESFVLSLVSYPPLQGTESDGQLAPIFVFKCICNVFCSLCISRRIAIKIKFPSFKCYDVCFYPPNKHVRLRQR